MATDCIRFKPSERLFCYRHYHSDLFHQQTRNVGAGLPIALKARWFLMAGIVYYFASFETRGRSIEQIGRKLAKGLDRSTAQVRRA